ncbi:hypothetical protein [Roseicella sp. DB1501]|uniref:hypothetical protein n=1 Tax=Roseicella sp. DB1501 TaxID=2730925 RepID=UPI0014930E77|nr:hypothetical protein [Roseicella sp. DB1501]NOG74017.1 hypothetical protein [Roseicella sp. DB1501]
MTAATSITVRVPLKIRRRPGRKTVVTPIQDADEATVSTRADPALVKALARAFRYQKLLDAGRYASISEMAAAEKIERAYLGSLLRLTLLAPDLVEQLMDGKASCAATLPELLQPFSAIWKDQNRPQRTQ